jgi:hypothetical protein
MKDINESEKNIKYLIQLEGTLNSKVNPLRFPKQKRKRAPENQNNKRIKTSVRDRVEQSQTPMHPTRQKIGRIQRTLRFAAGSAL